mmetsp:Transcript_15041/g.43447  ORF Transcript_15041/g.43447 Transcript_15041/m.43447 type:complete len:220 (-) Transcript_15041:270-929(-)
MTLQAVSSTGAEATQATSIRRTLYPHLTDARDFEQDGAYSDDDGESMDSEYSDQEERIAHVFKFADEREWQKEVRRGLGAWASEEQDSDDERCSCGRKASAAKSKGSASNDSKAEVTTAASPKAASSSNEDIHQRTDSEDSVSSLERVKRLGIKLIPNSLKRKTRVTVFSDEDFDIVPRNATVFKPRNEELTQVVPSPERRLPAVGRSLFGSRSMPAWM